MAEYIEREALYKILENWRDAHADVDDADGCGLLEDVMCEVKAQTAADVVPVVHGRWEHDSVGFDDFWKCSACREDWFFEYDPTEECTRVKYCPNCGAKMDGERKGGE